MTLYPSQQPGVDHVTQRLFCPSAGPGSILPQCWRELSLHGMVDTIFCPIYLFSRDKLLSGFAFDDKGC